jgi:hypothetical protein
MGALLSFAECDSYEVIDVFKGTASGTKRNRAERGKTIDQTQA